MLPHIQVSKYKDCVQHKKGKFGNSLKKNWKTEKYDIRNPEIVRECSQGNNRKLVVTPLIHTNTLES